MALNSKTLLATTVSCAKFAIALKISAEEQISNCF